MAQGASHSGSAAAFRRDAEYDAFEWRSNDAAVVQAGRQKLMQLKLSAFGQRSAVVWANLELLPDGVRLPWRKPSKYHAGYAWFSRNLGDLVPLVLGFGRPM